MKRQNVFLNLTVLLMLASCSVISAKGVDGSDEELLATLASLARRGTSAVCDPKVIEKEFGIKLGNLILEQREGTPNQQTVYEYTDVVISAISGQKYALARYSRWQNLERGSCRLAIKFAEQRLCNAATTSAEKILGVPVEFGPASPHGTDVGYNYFYKPSSGTKSSIYLGQSNSKCANQFELTTIGEWK